MGDESPKRLIREYKRALAHAKGERYAKETKVDYENGWFRVQRVDGTEKSYRKRQFVFFTEAFSEEQFDPNAYDEAVRQRQERETNKPSIPVFDAAAYNRAVAERIAVGESRTTQQRVISAQYSRSWRFSSLDCFIMLLLFAFTVGVFYWIHADSEKQKREAEAAREARETKARAEYEEREKRLRELAPAVTPARGRDSDPEYTTVLGKLRPSMKLYYRTTHEFYGFVTDIRWSEPSVEVALAKTIDVSSSRVSGYAVWLKRSYVTDNFVTKRSEL
jgi:hypothetical protein